jgi:hypothetical protein
MLSWRSIMAGLELSPLRRGAERRKLLSLIPPTSSIGRIVRTGWESGQDLFRPTFFHPSGLRE